MTGSSPPSFPSSFDPAIHLHSEPNDPIDAPNHLDADDLEALILQNRETIAQKTREGIVIQNRASKLPEAFRSDEDNQQQTPSRKRLFLLGSAQDSSQGQTIPSSPPIDIMAFASSPVAYPLSSSPPTILQKRKPVEQTTSPAAKRRRINTFFVEEDDEPDFDDREASQDDVTRESDLGELHATDDAQTRQNAPTPSHEQTNDCHEKSAELPSTQKKALFGKKLSLLRTCSGNSYPILTKKASKSLSYERLVAERSTVALGRAQTSYYGIDIHSILDDAKKEIRIEKTRRAASTKELPSLSVEKPPPSRKRAPCMMWTEKYRARKFTDLVGDERTHRSVLRWLKGWDSIVFPGLRRSKPRKKDFGDNDEEQSHRKILLLTGPPGLGKTTLAHVCARQAGYEVLEVNASDERSKDVVKGRIRDAVGTENVRGVNVETADGKVRKAGRPVCVIVDEVDGVVSGSGGSGEGGFIKALIDLVLLDQKNSNIRGTDAAKNSHNNKNRKGDNFRLLRPLILICNDVYHPSLRPLRASTIAEIIHIRKPPLDKVVQRIKEVFEREGVPSDADAIRRLCESTWGLGGRKEGRAGSRGSGEGDIRGILVAGEWIAHKLRSSSSTEKSRLTKKWIDQHLRGDSSHLGSSAHGLCRGGVREIVERVFLDGAGFPNTTGSSNARSTASYVLDSAPTSNLNPADLRKCHAISQLREMVDTTGDHDRCMTDCFAQYPSHPYQDDTFLSKPNAAYDWLHFHDLASSRVFSHQEWELSPYLSQSVLAFHDLFAAVGKHAWDSEKTLFDKDAANENEAEASHPFSGPRADFAAYEAEKAHRATLTCFQSTLPAPLLRSFRSPDVIATELLPRLMRMLAPDVKPVVVGGGGENRGIASVRKESERALVKYAAKVMDGLGVTFERARVESETGSYGGGGWVFRMEPPLDTITSFATPTNSSSTIPPVRYAIRQVLDQEYRTENMRAHANAREARYRHGGNPNAAVTSYEDDADKENDGSKNSAGSKPASGLLSVKRDFFGRIIVNNEAPNSATSRPASSEGPSKKGKESEDGKEGRKAWLHYHEGFSNAVRKPITLAEFMGGL